MFNARTNYNIPREVNAADLCHIVMMENQEKNSGPNYLEAWREFRGLTQDELAERAEPPTSQPQIAHLEAGRTGLSAKWLRRLAPALETTPGMLLDHDPTQLDNDIIDIWSHATDREKRQLSDIAKTIVRTGTND